MRLSLFLHFVSGSRSALIQILMLEAGFLAHIAGPVSLFPSTTDDAAAVAPSEVTKVIREIIGAGQLTDLRWPDLADYRVELQEFYESVSFRAVWTNEGKPKPQALAIIEALQDANSIGLNAEDYDASRWKERLIRLQHPEDAGRFDVALTACLMRYISDQRIGG